MSKTMNKFSLEVRERATRMVLENEGGHGSWWAAVVSIAAKIGCSAQTLNEWVKTAEVDSGRRAGMPSDMAEKLKALERENRELRQTNEILRKASAYFAQAELDRPFKRRRHLLTIIAWCMGPSRSAGSCRSPLPRIINMLLGGAIGLACRLVRSATRRSPKCCVSFGELRCLWHA